MTPPRSTARVRMWAHNTVRPSFITARNRRQIAEQVIGELDAQQLWDRSVVTTVEALEKFYVAEEYHQEYFARNPYHPCCQVVAAPKVARFR